MNSIRGILFDKDGTLLDFNKSWLAPYQMCADYLSKSVGKPELASRLMSEGGYIESTQSWVPDSLLASGSNDQIFDFWSEVLGQSITGARLEKVNSIFADAADHYVPVLADMHGFLSKLHQRGITLGVATMDVEHHARIALQKLGIEDVFDFVCGSDSGFGVKPEAGMVLAFCQHCNLEPGQVVMVGDSPRDINMGNNADVGLTVGVLTGAHDRQELERYADHVFDDISGLTKLLH